MKTNVFFIVVLSLLAAIGCGAPVETPQPCHLTPELPECSCDDGNPCTEDARDVDGCKNEHVVYGAACIGEPGFCDGSGVCRACYDGDSCTDDLNIDGICEYVTRLDGHSCTTSAGELGVCIRGGCTNEFPDTGECIGRPDGQSCNLPFHGACLNERCVPGE